MSGLRAGQDNYCLKSRFLGVNRAGAYSTHLLVPDAKYLVDAGGIDESFAATLACSALTAYSASAKLPALGAKDRVAVIGCGGVGLVGISVLRAKGVRNIIACDIDEAKLAAAARLGAKTTLDNAIADTVQKLQGVAGAIDFVGSPVTAALGHRRAAKGRALRAGRPLWRGARPSAAADRAARHRHRRLVRRQPPRAEGGGGAGEEGKAQADPGRDAHRGSGGPRPRRPESREGARRVVLDFGSVIAAPASARRP